MCITCIFNICQIGGTQIVSPVQQNPINSAKIRTETPFFPRHFSWSTLKRHLAFGVSKVTAFFFIARAVSQRKKTSLPLARGVVGEEKGHNETVHFR